MWRKIIPLLLALSVGMNIAVFGAWALRTRTSCGESSCGGSESCCALHEYLRAEEAQQRALGGLLEQFQEKARLVCRDIDTQRAELINLIAAEEPDTTAIAAKQAEILAGQGRMQALVVEQLLAEKAVLDPEQRRALFNLLRNHPGCSLPGLGTGGCAAGTGIAPTGLECPGHDR